MESSLNVLHRLTPVCIKDGEIMLSGPEGNLFSCSLNKPTVHHAPCNLCIHCDLFTLTQQDTNGEQLTRLYTSNKIPVQLPEISTAIENFSVFFRNGGISLSLFQEEERPPVSYLIAGTPSERAMTLRPGCVFFDDDAVLEMDNRMLRWGSDENEHICSFSALLCLSRQGVLLSVETPAGMSVRWYSPDSHKLKTITEDGDNVLQATFDDRNRQIIFTRIVSGQQCLSRYDLNTGKELTEPRILYGTVTPMMTASGLHLYITGTQEGISVLNIVTGERHSLVPGKPSVRRRYHEQEGIKVTSLVISDTPVLDVLMFHGGPESCEWDTPRLPGLLRQLTSAGVNFHIINYAGSAGFGQTYRTSVDQRVVAGSIAPVRQWLHDNLSQARVVLTGGSFGGTMALELLAAEPVPGVKFMGIIAVNPLLDLKSHLERVRQHKGDIAFFERKFSAKDIATITPSRYSNVLRTAMLPALFILGRHDEVLDVSAALRVARSLRKCRCFQTVVDDGSHAPLSHTVRREKLQLEFISSLLGNE